MSVYKSKNSPYWQYDFQWRGNRFHGSTGCTAKRDAVAFEAKVRSKAVLGGVEKQPLTLDEAAGLYQDKVETTPSWATTRGILNAMIAGIGASRLLSDISQRELMQLVAQRRNGRANSSVNREVEVWRAVWRHAAKARFDIGDMPDWGALMLKVARTPPRELTIEQEDRLLPEIRADLFDFCLFALKTGWRKGEVMGLRWVDVDLNAASATTRIKGGDTVSRALTQEMVVIIANQPKVGPFVFTYVAQANKSKVVDKLGRTHPARRKGERYPMTVTVLRKPWAEAKEAAGVELRFHDLRHTRGTRILRATGNLAAAKEALKHRSVKTTLRYAHVMDDDLRRALDASESRNSPGAKTDVAKKVS